MDLSIGVICAVLKLCKVSFYLRFFIINLVKNLVEKFYQNLRKLIKRVHKFLLELKLFLCYKMSAAVEIRS